MMRPKLDTKGDKINTMSDHLQCSIPCNLCESTNIDVLSTVDRERKYLRTVICKDCGLVWTDPRPDKQQLRDYYENDYRLQYKGTYTPKLKHVYRAGKVAIDRYSRIKKYIKKSDKIIDIGSGGGGICLFTSQTSS